MKKILSLISVALLFGAALTVSCKKLASAPGSGETPEGEETATLTITLSGIETDISARASSTDEYNNDKTASSVQLLIFDSAGNFIKKLTAAGSVSLSKGMAYTVAAVVNGPDVSGKNLSQTLALAADLSSNPFVMFGEGTADLSTASSASLNVSVSSLASRIHLTTIRNRLPGAFGSIVLKRIYLCNVKGQVQLDGTAMDTWYNQYGRKAVGTVITANSTTGAVDAETTGANYTFRSFETAPGASVYEAGTFYANGYFYTFPNPLKTAIPADVASTTTWNAQATWLTVCGQVNSNIYYWTANLGAALTNGLERNYSYDVSLTINNLGSPDPGTEVTEAEATLSVTVQPWQPGSEITQTL